MIDPTNNFRAFARELEKWQETINRHRRDYQLPGMIAFRLRPMTPEAMATCAWPGDQAAPAPDALEAAVSLYAGDHARLEPIPWRGRPLYTSELLTEELEDWSVCRSPSRARRRRAMGHPQRVRITRVPSSKVIHVKGPPAFYMVHPETFERIQRLMTTSIEGLL